MHTVRPGVWQEKRKLWKMRNTHCRTWNVARTSEKRRNEKYTVLDLYYREKRKNLQNETQTLYDLEYGQKQSKTWKMRNTHSRTWIMARKLKNMENETQTLFDLVGDKKQGKMWQIKNAH